jgi:beta-lactamase regulating signal transducer with metallopeptidase domain/DUF4097 and DUF4098 domain-containing protein YvlB
MNLVFLLPLLVKVTLLLAVAAGASFLLRRRTAAARHDVWSFALVAVIALAVAAPVAPSIALAVLPKVSQPASWISAAVDRGPLAAVNPSAPAPPSSSSAALPRIDGVGSPVALAWLRAARSPLLVLWALGTAAVCASIVVGHLGMGRLARRAEALDSDPWPSLLADAMNAAGVRRPVSLRASHDVSGPVVWGTRRPVILLPSSVESWPDERRRAALLHELAHVARFDALTQLAGLLACALYWFHPATWAALGKLRKESERACDDRVLTAGASPRAYAEQLLEVARDARALRLGRSAVAIGMARPSTLEGRLLAILDERVPRRGPSPRGRALAIAVLVAIVVPLAGLTLVTRAAASTAVSTAASTAASAYAEPTSPDDGRRTVEAASGETLHLDLETGAGVEIAGWDQSRVEVETQLGGRDWRATRVDIRRVEDGVRVHLFPEDKEHSTSMSTSHHLRIHVPSRFDVDLDSAGGELEIRNVEGTFSGSTGGGDLDLTHLKGTARLRTGGGEIHVSDSDLNGHVATGGGTVKLSRVTGGLRGSSGSGPVIYAEPAGRSSVDDRDDDTSEVGDIDDVQVNPGGSGRITVGGVSKDRAGRLHIERAGGDVDLDDAPAGAEIHTGGGQVVVRRGAGLVEASTGGGDVTVGPIAGSVHAITGAGRVEVTLMDAGGEPQTVEVNAGVGDVVLVLPADFDGTFELETAYTQKFGRATRIDSEWQLSREQTDRWDTSMGTPRRYVRARGTVGAGRGSIRVKTTNGDIQVKRGR